VNVREGVQNVRVENRFRANFCNAKSVITPLPVRALQVELCEGYAHLFLFFIYFPFVLSVTFVHAHAYEIPYLRQVRARLTARDSFSYA